MSESIWIATARARSWLSLATWAELLATRPATKLIPLRQVKAILVANQPISLSVATTVYYSIHALLVLIIQYRLSTENPFPRPVHDVNTAYA